MSEEHTGLSVSYYTVYVKHPTGDGQTAPAPYTAQCNDIIEALGMDYAEGNAFKAIWRTAAARRGLKKKGNNSLYDAEKVVFFGQRMVEKAKNESISKEHPLVSQPDGVVAPDTKRCSGGNTSGCSLNSSQRVGTGCSGKSACGANQPTDCGIQQASSAADPASGVTHLSLAEVMAQWQQRQDMEEALREEPEDYWRSWEGRGFPTASRVEVKFRDGGYDTGFVDHFYWHHLGDEGDIVAYRQVWKS